MFGPGVGHLRIFDVGIFSLLQLIPLGKKREKTKQKSTNLLIFLTARLIRYSRPAHLFLLQSLLDCVYVLLHRHVDELVLGLCLDHARPLLPNHLDGLGDVDVTVETWMAHMED